MSDTEGEEVIIINSVSVFLTAATSIFTRPHATDRKSLHQSDDDVSEDLLPGYDLSLISQLINDDPPSIGVEKQQSSATIESNRSS